MKSLYAILGIEKSAGEEQVRKAYRRASRKAHPDVGGTNEEFAEIKLAYDVLIDPERRKRYDETGQFDQSGPNNADRVAMTWIYTALDQTLAALMRHHGSIEGCDIKSDMVAWLKKAKLDLGQSIKELHTKDVVWKSIKSKFVSKDGDTCLESMIDSTISITNQMIEQQERKQSQIDVALALLGKFTFVYTKKDGWTMSVKMGSHATLGIGFGGSTWG